MPTSVRNMVWWMKLSFLSKEYIRFDERGHKKIRPKPFLKPALEMAMKKIFGKKEMDLRGNKK